MTEAPSYIKKAANGCFVLCPEADAQGLVFGGVPYTLLGRAPMEGTRTAALSQSDAGMEIADLQSAVDDLVVASLEGGALNV